MITPETYMRRSFEIEAVRVTADNMHEISLWCMGSLETQKRPSKKGEGGYIQEVPYIRIDVLRPLNPKQTMAFVGDWVLKTGTSFKIYSDIAFHKNFEKKEKYDDILLPESEAEFMVLRNGAWEPMSPQELKEKLAPVVRETIQDIQHEQNEAAYEHEIAMSQHLLNRPKDDLEELRVVDEPSGIPQVHLSQNPQVSENPSD